MGDGENVGQELGDEGLQEGENEGAVQEESTDEQEPQGEAGDISSLRETISQQSQQIELLKSMVGGLERYQTLAATRQEAAQEKDPLAELDPDEPLTAKHIAIIREQTGKAHAKELDSLRLENRKAIARISEKAAKAAYTDYDAVVNLAADLARTNPALVQLIANDPDPAEMAYRVGLTHPKYKAPKAPAQGKSQEGKGPKPLSSMPQGKPAKAGKEEDDPLNWTREQLLKHRQKLGL